MVMMGETISTGASDTCPDCGIKPKMQVCLSAAGHYVGTKCDCGPYSRESDYYKNFGEAEEALKNGNFGRL